MLEHAGFAGRDIDLLDQFEDHAGNLDRVRSRGFAGADCGKRQTD